MPIIEYPLVLQKRSHDCGPAVVEAALRFLGVDPTPILKVLPLTEWDGLDPRSIEGVLRGQGLRVLSGESEICDLQHAARLGRPVLCLITLSGMGHWVASKGVLRGQVHYHDPSHGPRKMSVGEWTKRWYDRDRSGIQWRQFGLQVWQ